MKHLKLLLVAASLFVAQAAFADPNYPNKPITLVVPFSAGGGTDLVARVAGQKLSEVLKTPVVVENRAGASSQIGTRYVIDAPADGYTLLVGTTSIITGPYLFPKLSYDAKKQLRPVGSLADLPIVLAVNSQLGLKTFADFSKAAKASNKGLNFGSAGAGTTLHLSSEWLKVKMGIQATHVPFKGSGDAVAALTGGHIDFDMENISAILPMVNAKKVNLLTIASPQRHPLIPDVPTTTEVGLPAANLSTWLFIMAPAATPDAIVTRLNTELNKILQSPDMKDKLIANGFFPVGGSVADMNARMTREAVLWEEVIKTNRIVID
jgi:tripartite-type tricarboxylate transporter receptor subunit TctC